MDKYGQILMKNMRHQPTSMKTQSVNSLSCLISHLLHIQLVDLYLLVLIIWKIKITYNNVYTLLPRQSVAQKTLKENSPQTSLKSVSKNYCKDASSQLSKGDFWMPSQELKIVSHYPKDLLLTKKDMLINSSGKKAQHIYLWLRVYPYCP